MRTWRNITREGLQRAKAMQLLVTGAWDDETKLPNESRVELRGEVDHFALLILGERKVHRG